MCNTLVIMCNTLVIIRQSLRDLDETDSGKKSNEYTCAEPGNAPTISLDLPGVKPTITNTTMAMISLLYLSTKQRLKSVQSKLNKIIQRSF